MSTKAENASLSNRYLKVNERMRELLEDKNRPQLDIRIVYGKKHQPNEINWLKDFRSVKVKYCQNLHAKCYLSEQQCIVTRLMGTLSGGVVAWLLNHRLLSGIPPGCNTP
ncbi:MAG: repair protein [Planctomycetaceae bacterium]|nr:repair protein [Planctomycetaceae bacterium]